MDCERLSQKGKIFAFSNLFTFQIVTILSPRISVVIDLIASIKKYIEACGTSVNMYVIVDRL